ncbi:YfiR family protein [Vibrio lentus]
MSVKRLEQRAEFCQLFAIDTLALILLLTSFGWNATSFSNNEMKAIYLLRIANFIRWDNESQMNSVDFCVIGDKEASDLLTSFTNGETMRLLPIHIHQTVTPLCDITYFTVADEGFDNSLYSLDMITVSPTPNFTRMGGVVELVTVDSKIKPKINLDNAKRGNDIIGSNLLRIAVVEGN